MKPAASFAVLASALLAGAAQTQVMAQAQLQDEAPAQEEHGPSLEGGWVFQTEAYHSIAACSMRGEIELTQTAPGRYSCRLWTEESCPDALPLITSEQVCTASVNSGVLNVRSTVLSWEPGIDGVYLPDNFTLRVESAWRMEGVMHAPGEPGAVFERIPELVS